MTINRVGSLPHSAALSNGGTAGNALFQAIPSGAASATSSTHSNGTTPSSLCSTPSGATLLGQPGASPFLPHHLNLLSYGANMANLSLLAQSYPNATMASPYHPMVPAATTVAANTNAFEGIPIFLVPQAGNGAGGLSLNAFQRISDFKALAAQSPKIDTSKHFHVFVGDLSSEVDNAMLKDAFQRFGEISEAKVIRDPQSLKSRGYGFVAFPHKEDAVRSIEEMNGQTIGRRAVRTNWASRKNQEEEKKPLSFDEVFKAAAEDNTTVYMGNIGNVLDEETVRKAFTKYGSIKEIRLFSQQNYGFVIFEAKESAANAILEMNGQTLAGQTLKCSWGRTQELNHNNQMTSAPNVLMPMDNSSFPTLNPTVASNLLPQFSLAAANFVNPLYQLYNQQVNPTAIHSLWP